MFGKLLSTGIRLTTLPLDAGNAAIDVVTGGTGRKRSRADVPLGGDLERIRDAVAETTEEIDE